jgi:hypothetical protein
MFLENQGFAKMRAGRIPPSPPDKPFIFNYLQLHDWIRLPGSRAPSHCNKGIYLSLNGGECRPLRSMWKIWPEMPNDRASRNLEGLRHEVTEALAKIF